MKQADAKTYKFNGARFIVTAYRGRYVVEGPNAFRRKYSAPSDCHADVLLSALDDAGQLGKIDTATANWPEDKIRQSEMHIS